MAKFADRNQKVRRGTSPIATTGNITPEGGIAFTYNAGLGHVRDAKSELFLLGVTNFVSEDTFYEGKNERDARFANLVGAVTREDPTWVALFVAWLRGSANMRSAAIVAAAHYALAGGPNPRNVVSSALQRPDEPGEFIAYWRSVKGRTLSGGVQRGVADAATRLFNENAALRYDGGARTYRLGDVIEIAHPTPKGERQAHLFKVLLDARHHGDARPDPELVPVVSARADLEAIPAAHRRDALRTEMVLGGTGIGSWEWLSGWLPDGMDAEAWEAVIPTMGYMALLRNLRNFDQANIGAIAKALVAAKLSNPDEVARSRQLPLRFYSAYANVESDFWKPVLSDALNASLANVPALHGRTLIMVDVSGSMFEGLSARGERQRWEVAFLFGQALANRADKAALVSYSNSLVEKYNVGPNVSILGAVDRVRHATSNGRGRHTGDGNLGGYYGGGTATWQSTGEAFRKFGPFDRVVIITDEQADPGRDEVPPDVPVFTINVAGYQYGHAPSNAGNRFTFGGLTDAMFGMIPLIEAGRGGSWPWEDN